MDKGQGFALTAFICIVMKFLLLISHLGQGSARLLRSFTPDLH